MQKTIKTHINNAQAATNLGAIAATLAVILLVGCASKPLPPHTPTPAPAPAPARPPAPAPVPAPSAPPAVVQPAGPAGLPAVNSMAEYRRRAARMIIAANQSGSFSGPLPDPLHGIAVVNMQFNANGTLRVLDLMRRSSVAPEVNQMAMDAVRRVGDFGSIANLPQPWQFSETFFYNDNRKFQLVTIVENR